MCLFHEWNVNIMTVNVSCVPCCLTVLVHGWMPQIHWLPRLDCSVWYTMQQWLFKVYISNSDKMLSQLSRKNRLNSHCNYSETTLHHRDALSLKPCCIDTAVSASMLHQQWHHAESTRQTHYIYIVSHMANLHLHWNHNASVLHWCCIYSASTHYTANLLHCNHTKWSYTATTLHLHWNHTALTLKPHCTYTATTLHLHWNHTALTLKPHWMKLHCTYTALTLKPHCTYTATTPNEATLQTHCSYIAITLNLQCGNTATMLHLHWNHNASILHSYCTYAATNLYLHCHCIESTLQLHNIYTALTHVPLVLHMCVNESGQRWFR